MSNRSNRKVVKFNKQYLITVDGQTDTTYPEDTPLTLSVIDKALYGIVEAMDSNWKLTNVTIKERQ